MTQWSKTLFQKKQNDQKHQMTQLPISLNVTNWQEYFNIYNMTKLPKSNYFEKCSILAKNTKWLNEYIRFLNDQKQITYHFYNEWPKTLNDPLTTLIYFKLCFLSYPKEWLKAPNDSIITYSFFLKQMTKKYKGPNDS